MLIDASNNNSILNYLVLRPPSIISTAKVTLEPASLASNKESKDYYTNLK